MKSWLGGLIGGIIGGIITPFLFNSLINILSPNLIGIFEKIYIPMGYLLGCSGQGCDWGRGLAAIIYSDILYGFIIGAIIGIIVVNFINKKRDSKL